MNNRYSNYGLWVALAALVLLVLQSAGIGVDTGKYNQIVNAVLGILAMLGILSDPTTINQGFKDD